MRPRASAFLRGKVNPVSLAFDRCLVSSTPMFCTKCGKVNTDDAVYCQKCGALLEPEDETVVALRSKQPVIVDHLEEHLMTVGPTLKFVKLGYVLAVIVALV